MMCQFTRAAFYDADGGNAVSALPGSLLVRNPEPMPVADCATRVRGSKGSAGLWKTFHDPARADRV